MSVFPTYSNLTGVQRKYVKYWQIFIYQVVNTFVYTRYLLLHYKRDHPTPEVGRFLEIIAVCVLASTLCFMSRLAPGHCTSGI